MRPAFLRRILSWRAVALGMVIMVATAACSQGISKDEAAAKDRQIQDLQAQVAAAQTQLSSSQQDVTYWKQLTALLQPVEMKSMSDHRAYMLPSGVLLALHFDNMDLKQAKNLNWVAWGVPGTFCKSDQQRLQQLYGQGVTHFHDMAKDTHGGAPGAMGVWFVHTAVREFDSPMSGGRVKPGVDTSFMPTPAPNCAS